MTHVFVEHDCIVREVHTVVHQCSADSPRSTHFHRYDHIGYRRHAFLFVGRRGIGTRWIARV